MKKKKILVVDDEENNRWILVKVLEEEYHVFQAGDGQEALQMISDCCPDLVITDLGMPRMRGEEVLRWITKEYKKEHPLIRTIVLSGEIELEPVVRAAGCDMFFEKPFDLFALRGEVERLLGGN